MIIQTLALDFETRSAVNLKTAGMYKYMECPHFDIMLFAYKVNDEATVCLDLLNGDVIPDFILAALSDPNVIKTAHNAAFEFNALVTYFARRFINIVLDYSQWRCNMVQAYRCGLPGDLFTVSQILGLTQFKMFEGKALINKFCVPRTRKKNDTNFNLFNTREDYPEDWELFKRYCIRDVEAEVESRKRMEFIPVTPTERRLEAIDSRINRRGLLCDRVLIHQAITMFEQLKEELSARLFHLTGIRKASEVQKIKDWLSSELDEDIVSLRKDDLPKLLQKYPDTIVEEVIRIRMEIGKSSVSKFVRMAVMMCADGRLRGMFQLLGAMRTGRYAGRGVQLQNLSKNKTKAIYELREFVRTGNTDMVKLFFGQVAAALSQLTRTAFIPSPGYDLATFDFSAIEACVIAWLANEEWRLEAFRNKVEIYSLSAAKSFGVDINTIRKGHENFKYRALGKIGELALGFGGGKGALLNMAKTLNMTLDVDPETLKVLWRQESPRIVQMWKDFENCARTAIQNPGILYDTGYRGVSMCLYNGVLQVRLPSGRILCYAGAHLVGKINDYGSYVLEIRYYGVNDKGRWGILTTYGGKLTENIVQAIARDCLVEKIILIEDNGFPIVLHVHDEAGVEIRKGSGHEHTIHHLMGLPIDWAPGLPLSASADVLQFYMKTD